MVTVKLFGLMQPGASKTRFEVEPGTVRGALTQMCALAPDVDIKRLRQAVMFINGAEKRGITRLSAPLRDGDELVLLSPVSGG